MPDDPYNITDYHTFNEELQHAQLQYQCYLEDGPLEGEFVFQTSLYPPRLLTFETPTHLHVYYRAFRDPDGDDVIYTAGREAHVRRLLFRHQSTDRIAGLPQNDPVRLGLKPPKPKTPKPKVQRADKPKPLTAAPLPESALSPEEVTATPTRKNFCTQCGSEIVSQVSDGRPSHRCVICGPITTR